MAKKKKKKKSGGLFGFFSSKKKKGRRSSKQSSVSAGTKIALTILFLSVLAAGGAVGLIYMEQSVKNAAAAEVPDGSLKLINPPGWLNQQWVDKLAETVGGKRFPLDPDSTRLVAERLETLSWLENVRVQATPEYMTVRADYRRPVAVVQVSRHRQIYLDAQMNVLDYTPVSGIPVIEIKGLASTQVPPAGAQWFADDAKAAVELLNLLYRMDLNFQQQKEKQDNRNAALPTRRIPEKPLLDEVASIDVSNFAARKSRSKPNIVFDIKGGVKVYWGAAWGQATVYLEADEKDKLNRLYGHFMDYDNTFQGSAKYVELRWLENGIPRPR